MNSTSTPPYAVTRRFPRYEAHLALDLRRENHSDISHGMTGNMSQGGLFLWLSGELPAVGEHVHLDFNVPEGHRPVIFSLRAEVTSVVSEMGVGLRFCEMPHATFMQLGSLVERASHGEFLRETDHPIT